MFALSNGQAKFQCSISTETVEVYRLSEIFDARAREDYLQKLQQILNFEKLDPLFNTWKKKSILTGVSVAFSVESFQQNLKTYLWPVNFIQLL